LEDTVEDALAAFLGLGSAPVGGQVLAFVVVVVVAAAGSVVSADLDFPLADREASSSGAVVVVDVSQVACLVPGSAPDQ
jgi:hypothetical protein